MYITSPEILPARAIHSPPFRSRGAAGSRPCTAHRLTMAAGFHFFQYNTFCAQCKVRRDKMRRRQTDRRKRPGAADFRTFFVYVWGGSRRGLSSPKGKARFPRPPLKGETVGLRRFVHGKVGGSRRTQREPRQEDATKGSVARAAQSKSAQRRRSRRRRFALSPLSCPRGFPAPGTSGFFAARQMRSENKPELRCGSDDKAKRARRSRALSASLCHHFLRSVRLIFRPL